MRLKLKKVHQAIEQHFYTPPVLELFAHRVSVTPTANYTMATQWTGPHAIFGPNELVIDVEAVALPDEVAKWSDIVRESKRVNVNLTNNSSIRYHLMDTTVIAFYIQHDWITDTYMMHLKLDVNHYSVEYV